MRNADSKNELRLRIKLEVSAIRRSPTSSPRACTSWKKTRRRLRGIFFGRTQHERQTAVQADGREKGFGPVLRAVCAGKIKIEGKIMPVNKLEMTPKMVKQAAIELMDEDQLEDVHARARDRLRHFREPGLGRFRVNIFHQRGNVAMVLRYITSELPTLDELGMPPSSSRIW